MSLSAARTLLPLFVLAALAGCSGSSLLAPSGPPPALYTLNAPAQLSVNAAQATWQLAVDQPAAMVDLDSERIAVAPSPERMDFYANVAWIDRAPKLLQALLVESFDRSGRIAAVQRQGGSLRSDFLLTTTLHHFEVTAGPPAAVRVDMTMKLVRLRDRSIVASREFNAAVPVSTGIDSIVAGFDSALGQLLPGIVDWTLTQGNAHP
jgi:cholesterol transport system auxiliary component